MSKRKWHTRALYIIVTLVMTLGLLMAPAAVQADPAASVSITPTPQTVLPGATFPVNVMVDSGTDLLQGCTVEVGYDTTAFDATSLTYDNLLGADVLVEPGSGINDVAGLVKYGVTRTAANYPPEAVSGRFIAMVFTVAPDAAPGMYTLDVKNVQLVGWTGDPDASPYGIIPVELVDGEVVIEIPAEEIVPALLPDISYNVKTAAKTFTVIDTLTGNPVAGALVSNWQVIKGCGPGEVLIIDGGNPVPAFPGIPGNNFITVRMVVKGDCNITALVDTNYDGVPDTEVSAEKKWGEIYTTCLEVTQDDPLSTEYRACDTLWAEFLWGDCSWTELLPADGAIITWWLMDVKVLPQIVDIADDLGSCPDGVCDDDDKDGCGCGTWIGAINDPYTNIEDLFNTAGNKTDLLNLFLDNGLQKIETVSGDAGVTGMSCVPMDVSVRPSGVILVIHADYPISKHGENRECVEWYTWTPEVPETIEKLPLIAWVGEKTVVEWNLGIGSFGDTVSFTSEFPYSVGLLEAPEGGPASHLITTTVGRDGIARCIVHSDKSGKTNLLAVVTSHKGEPVPAPAPQQGFIVYWIAIESVELVNVEDSDLPNPAWETPGLTYELMDIGDTTTLRARVTGYFVDPDPEWQSTRPASELDTDGDGTADIVLPAGRWVLPDDWNTLAGGAMWQIQKPHWDIMDELDDAIVSWGFGEWGSYDATGDVNSPSGVATCPVIGPFSTAQPWTALQWVTTPAAVAADFMVSAVACTETDVRTTVVPDYNCNLFDAVMPPLMVYFVADSGSLATVDKGGIYYNASGYYTFPYYKQEIPSSWLIDPYYGEGAAGYRWDSWDAEPVDAPVTVKGPYDFYEPLPLWDYDYSVINAAFGYGITPADEQLVLVYTDNHGEAYAQYRIEWIGKSTIQAVGCYPFLVGDFNTVVSNPVEKETVNQKDIKVAWERIDDMTDMLYVFIRDYDGTPAL